MKIAHIVRRYTKAEWGGTETVVENTVREQLALGHDVRIFATSALAREESDAGTSYFGYFYPYFPLSEADRLALDKKGGSPYAPKLFAAVRRWSPDVLHIHAGGRLAAAGVRLGQKLGVPTVYSLHGGAAAVPQAEMDEMCRPMRRKIPYGAVLDRLFGLRFDPIARASAVVCISREEESRLKAKYGPERIHYLPNGVAAAPKDGGSSGRGARTGERRTVNVLCVSRIDYQKNQLALVEAVARLPSRASASDVDFSLTLVGPVTAAWYRDKILARVGELGLGDRFALIPGLPPGSAALEAEFAKADVFVLPSVHEPFGIVALEAMSRGIPLVSSRAGGLKDFVTDGVNGLLFDPNAAEAVSHLASAILRATCPETAEVLRANGLRTAADYAWPSIVARLMKIYRSEGG
jgi:glycosyltransferase involved in cell wall biosynthesis